MKAPAIYSSLILFISPFFLHAQDLSNWMSDNWSLISDKKLSEIVIMGSHDAGMSTAQDCACFASNCNTQTQTYPIAAQLDSGYRYFDLRPVFFDSHDCPAWYLGHFDCPFQSEPDDCFGCLGESLDTVLMDVANFLESNKEVVVLDFSHYFVVSNPLIGFKLGAPVDSLTQTVELDYGSNPFVFGGGSGSAQVGLVDLVDNYLGNYLYKGALSDTTKLNQFIPNDSTKGTALAIFNTPGDFVDMSGYYDEATLAIYNEYSDTTSMSAMVCDQKNKFLSFFDTENDIVCDDVPPPVHPTGHLFLLSWTLTEGNVTSFICGMEDCIPIVMDLGLTGVLAAGCTGLCSITDGDELLDLAGQANGILNDSLSQWIDQNYITASRFPNIIFTDNASSTLANVGYNIFKDVIGPNEYLNEIHHNPDQSGSRSIGLNNQEFIEIINHDASNNFDGWEMVVDGETKHAFEGNLMLDSGEAILLVENLNPTFTSVNCDNIIQVSSGSLDLSDVSSNIILKTSTGFAKDAFNYENQDESDHASFIRSNDGFVRHNSVSSELSSPGTDTSGNPYEGCELTALSVKSDPNISFVLQPNPASDRVSISLHPMVKSEMVKVNIIDMTGRSSESKYQVSDGNIDVPLNLNPGVYFINILSESTRVFSIQKLIVE